MILLALSIDPGETEAVLSAYARENGMTFPAGSDNDSRLACAFPVMFIPASVAVYRFGSVAAVETGAMTGAEGLTELFDGFLSDDHPRTRVREDF